MLAVTFSMWKEQRLNGGGGTGQRLRGSDILLALFLAFNLVDFLYARVSNANALRRHDFVGKMKQRSHVAITARRAVSLQWFLPAVLRKCRRRSAL
jgi:hypothetical protein